MTRLRLQDLRFGDVERLLGVIRQHSVAGAARELSVAPSQVSRAVSRLEALLRIKLIARARAGIRITEAARELAPQLEQLLRHLQRMSEGGASDVRVMNVVAPPFLLTDVLPLMVHVRPQDCWRAIELPESLIRAYAYESLFDLAVTSGEISLSKEWSIAPLGHIRKALFTNPAFAKKLGRAPISPSAAARLRFVSSISQVNGQFVPVEDGCPLPRSQRVLGHEVDTARTALDLVAQNDEVAFVPANVAEPLLRARRLVEVRVQGWNVEVPVSLLCHSERVLAATQRDVLIALRTFFTARTGRH